jgi:hypothetical protein
VSQGRLALFPFLRIFNSHEFYFWIWLEEEINLIFFSFRKNVSAPLIDHFLICNTISIIN